MREIKFRAWHRPFKKTKWGSEYIYGPKAFNFWNMSPEDYILEQYTGLHDKNGKEIYESDIVEIIGLFGFKFIGQVVYDQFGFNLKDFWCSGFDYPSLAFSEEHEWEVIGNIHENPEFLEKN